MQAALSCTKDDSVKNLTYDYHWLEQLKSCQLICAKRYAHIYIFDLDCNVLWRSAIEKTSDQGNGKTLKWKRKR